MITSKQAGLAAYPPPERFLYYEGTTFTVEWYYTRAGRLPGLEHYLASGLQEQERLDHMVMYLADAPLGTRLPLTMYRLEDGGNQIYAFKPKSERFFNFMTVGRRIVVVNGYRKHAQAMDTKDHRVLKAAIGYRRDYLDRIREGSYYAQP